MQNKEIVCQHSDNCYIKLEDGALISLRELKNSYQEQKRLLSEQSNSALLGEMIPMIAHQWQQPIQIISILIQKLSMLKMIDKASEDKFIEDITKDATEQLKYMSKTIDDFRNFFMPQKRKRYIKVSKLTAKAEKFLKLMFAFDEIKFEVKTINDYELYIHTNEITHVFINIFKNARDAMIEQNIQDRKIVVTNEHDDKFAIIKIEDNAGGVPQNVLANVFEKYFTTKDINKGTGLGLYMCKKIVEESYGGTIDVENGENGAIFTIKLPLNLGEKVVIQ